MAPLDTLQQPVHPEAIPVLVACIQDAVRIKVEPVARPERQGMLLVQPIAQADRVARQLEVLGWRAPGQVSRSWMPSGDETERALVQFQDAVKEREELVRLRVPGKFPAQMRRHL